ncbi:hypothetical protein SAMN04489761_4356 [Tenacibaculum sp. MAR_2009_124]|nr:hypothetical protein SAMN04489761_4356 [Tenacibaculum sp. MAR_2009_124]
MNIYDYKNKIIEKHLSIISKKKELQLGALFLYQPGGF